MRNEYRRAIDAGCSARGQGEPAYTTALLSHTPSSYALSPSHATGYLTFERDLLAEFLKIDK
jgi:hypothetical protein